MFELNGKVALVTGACGSIGRGIVDALHKNGADVVVSGTNEDKLKELVSLYNERCSYIQCDLGDTEQTEALINNIEEKLNKKIDILVNNAGITADALMMRMSDDAFKSVLNLNLEAPFRLMRACIKNMMKARWGRIINISSVVGAIGNAGQTNYCATKAGIVGMSKSLAKEVASRGITVNCVAPGMIKSPMVDKIPEDKQGEMLKHIPAGRVGTPEDVGACVAFLATNEASYITGHVLHVNGGMAMM